MFRDTVNTGRRTAGSDTARAPFDMPVGAVDGLRASSGAVNASGSRRPGFPVLNRNDTGCGCFTFSSGTYGNTGAGRFALPPWNGGSCRAGGGSIGGAEWYRLVLNRLRHLNVLVQGLPLRGTGAALTVLPLGTTSYGMRSFSVGRYAPASHVPHLRATNFCGDITAATSASPYSGWKQPFARRSWNGQLSRSM
jgi:hypothetical protein